MSYIPDRRGTAERGRPISWFFQILVQGAILAAITVIAVSIGSLPVQLGTVVLIAWLLWMIGRNPAMFYRRLLRSLVLLSVPGLILTSSFTASGHAVLPDGRGELAFHFGQDGNLPTLVLLVLASICLLGDGLIAFVEARRSARILPIATAQARIVFRADGSVSVVKRFPVQAGSENLSVSGARLEIGTLLASAYPCEVHVPPRQAGAPERPIVPGCPLRLSSGQRAELRVEGSIPRGVYARWLRLRVLPPLKWFGPPSARIVITGERDIGTRITLALAPSPA